MPKRLSDVTAADYEELLREMQGIAGCSCAQESAQRFVDRIYERFCGSLVLLRLFMTVRYDELAGEDRRFVDDRCRQMNILHQLNGTTPIFTLFGTRGKYLEWNHRRTSSFFRCIPLISTAFVSSLSMLSRQFESVGFDLGLIDEWEAGVTSAGRADQYRGMLYIRDAAIDKDSQGRMIVPKQEFVTANEVKTTIGFGSGYSGYPALVTLFAFTNEIAGRSAVKPFTDLLEVFMTSTESLVRQGRYFEEP